MTAVSNSGPLIHLSWISHLDLLRELFGQVLIPLAVHEEVLRADPDVPGVEAIRAAFGAGWVQVRRVQDRASVAALARLLDRGEAEAIILMREVAAEVLLLDDKSARDEAERRGIPLTGTIGVLQAARERDLIESVYPLVLELRDQGFWVSAGLLDQVRIE